MRSTLALAALASAAAAAANICATNATIYSNVLAVLNLTHPSLAPVAAAAARGDAGGACEALATYYATASSASWLRLPAPPPPSTRLAGGTVDPMVLHDIFYLSGVDATAKVPRNADGGLDWLDRGPRDDYEFMNSLNRHDAFTQTLAAYYETGNEIYSAYFDALVSDWVLHNPCPGALGAASIPACSPQNVSGAPCTWAAALGAQRCVANPAGFVESPWRSLEMGIRMLGAWPASFFGFQGARNFSVTGRVLMALAVGEHLAALAVDKCASGFANWYMTQWQGLVTATVAFPELAHADELRALALAKLEEQLTLNVYADGVETEQSSGYHMATANDFSRHALDARARGRAAAASQLRRGRRAHVRVRRVLCRRARLPPAQRRLGRVRRGLQRDGRRALQSQRLDLCARQWRCRHAARRRGWSVARLALGGAGRDAQLVGPPGDVGLVRRGAVRVLWPRRP